MFTFTLKFFFIYFCSCYIYLKITAHHQMLSSYLLQYGTISLFLSLLTYFINNYSTLLAYSIPFAILCIYNSQLTIKLNKAFSLTSFSYALSYIIFALSSYIIVAAFTPLYYDQPNRPYLLITFFSIILQCCSIILIFHLKRFNTAIPFFNSKTFINITTVITLLIFSILIYIQSKQNNIWNQLILLVSFLLTFILLIFYWKSEITQSYKWILLYQQLDSLRTELNQKDKLIAELKEQNEQMGRLIHQDNKMLPAMENAVCEYLITAEKDTEAITTQSEELILEIQKLSRYRKDVLKQTDVIDYIKYDVGINSLNMLLNFSSKRSYEEHVAFTVNNAVNLHDYIPNIISDTDLTHTLSNLLDNAFIATKSIAKPVIQVQFYVSKNAFIIEVADNGTPFEISSLVNFGIQQLTTHETTGGTGIGLMEIWKQKELCRASLHIVEYKTAEPFTKKIAIIFNKKNKYNISTYRKSEIINTSNRLDLQVYEQGNTQ